MWTLLYLFVVLLLFWILVRFLIWQAAKFVKSKFNVDVLIKSIGLFSAQEITIRVNQQQTIEVDKVSLKLKLFKSDARHLINFHIGELRVRAEMKSANATPTPVPNISQSVKTHKRSSSFATQQVALINIVEKFFKYASLHIDVLNVMLLNALVPDSLVHLNLAKIRLASDTSVVTQEETSECAIIGSLCVESMDGKILKSRKEISEVTSCIAEISTSMELVVMVEQLQPSIVLSTVDAELSKLQIELHEGALIPGIVFPKLKMGQQNNDRVEDDDPFVKKLQGLITKAVDVLPASTSLSIRSFGVAFFGDETMGETTRGAHVVANQIALKQFKDVSHTVAVKIGEDRNNSFDIPSGYIRLQIDDVTMTDYYKRKVAEMGKTLIESKLNSNGVLSNSFDFTAWHADYKHKESILFWSIIFNKFHDAQRQQAVFGQTLARPHTTSRSNRESPQLVRRVRTFSAPDGLSRRLAPDILEGTEASLFEDPTYPDPTHSLPQLLREAGISVIFECTIYDASIDVIMTPLVATGEPSDFPPSFSIGLDSFTGILDQSSQSGDFNFMSKLDRLWCMVEQDNDANHFGSNGKVGRNHPTIRSNVHEWGHAVTLDNLSLHGSASLQQQQPIGSQHRSDVTREVSLLVDVKVSGLQLEMSKFAAQALESCLRIVKPVTYDDDDVTALRHPLRRMQTTVETTRNLPPGGAPQHAGVPTRPGRPGFRYKLSCVEVDLTRVNVFVLSSDDMRCSECVVARVDQFKADINGSNAMSDDDDVGMSGGVSLLGVAIATVHNPYFSAFASYEAGRNGGRGLDTPITPSMRKRQTEVAQYTCRDAALMGSRRLAFEVLEAIYSTKYEEAEADSTPPPTGSSYNLLESKTPKRPRRLRRHLAVTLSSEDKVTVIWSPSLHALIHYHVFDIAQTLKPYLGSNPNKPLSTSQSQLIGNNGDGRNAAASHEFNEVQQQLGVGSSGDGVSPKQAQVLELSVNLAPVELQLDVSDKQTVSLCLAALSCEQSEHVTSLNCSEVAIVMDGNQVFSFVNSTVELASWNATCQNHRKTFSNLRTETNRCWSFNIESCRLHFPYQYDFAAAFDQTITTWKWVKGLYRKTSHPFRSKRLPPDLQINVAQFAFELADWLFECRLRDNQELMMDEWTESEKRRRVLDQRMAEMRRQRGEILPAKKVEELYRKLSHTNVSIYLTRAHKMARHTRTSPPVLLTWSLVNLRATVLADDSMNGMRNAMNTIHDIDNVSPFPFRNYDGDDPEFVTLWCRTISLHAAKHQVRLRNYPQCLMDYSDWKVYGRLCGAEQKGPPSAQRTEYVNLPAPWGRAKVLRNMPPLKFYHDLSSEVHTFNMAWGPCWDPAWGQVNLALNLLTKMSIDPSSPLPWWDKSRMLFHGKLAISMDRVNMLHLASLDPYNTTEHMHWDWKRLYMDWTPGCFMFKGDLDIHIRNASKYDDVRFLHLPQLKMECSFDWVCLDAANPHNHHAVTPSAPDKLEGDPGDHDSYRYFRSRNIDLSITMDTRNGPKHARCDTACSTPQQQGDRPEVLLYSTTLRWLSNFGTAINAVTRPICRGSIFGNKSPPKLKLSRHYRNVKLSFAFPELKVSYWSSYAQQLGIEWLCGTGEVDLLFRLTIVPYEGDLIRRSLGEWSITSTTCELKDTKIYLLKQKESGEEQESHSSSARSHVRERNFLLSLSQMSYRRDNVVAAGGTRTRHSGNSSKSGTTKGVPRTPSRTEFDDQRFRKSKRPKKPTSPTKRPQNSQNLIVHDLKAMWTTDNRDIGYGLYEAYNKAAVLRRNLSTKILSKFRIRSASADEAGASTNRRPSQMTPDGEHGSGLGQEGMDPSFMLRQLLAEPDSRSVVGSEERATEQQQLKGVAACSMEDVANQNWLIKFVNCQAMLKGPKTQGYMILTAAQADFINREHNVMWRNGQLTTKSSWVGSLAGTQVFATVEKTVQSSGKNDFFTQVFATVEKTVQSSGQEDANVPWLQVSDIAPRGPSPGMLDISDLMGGGQAIGGVVGDGVSAGSYQLQRIMLRCTCRMYYVGYEALIDSEQTDYGGLLPETPAEDESGRHLVAKARGVGGRAGEGGSDLLRNEKPVNMLTIEQSDLEICTNTSQFTMILDIVENLLLYVEPVMRDFWERTDRMRFKLQLTSTDDAAKRRDTLAAMQNRIRARLTNMRQLERQLFRVHRALDLDQSNLEMREEANELRHTLAEEKETLNEESEELGIIIRCFKELFIEQKTRHSSLRPSNDASSTRHQQHHQRDDVMEEEEASVARTTEVAFGHVKWHLTDADGQLTIAQFEMRDFLYEKTNKSDETVSHCFELGSLGLLNLLPNSLYRDVIKLNHQMGLRTHGVTGAGGRSLTFRVLCRVRPPVGGISVKDHVEVNAAPLTIQLTYQFFKRLMSFFFPDKGAGADDADADSKSATLLGVGASSGLERHASILSLPSRPPPPSPVTPSTPAGHRKTKSFAKAIDDVDKMKQRAAENNTFLYIKITQVPLCVSYKGEKEKNIEDVHEFNLTIPMLEYHSMTWTWHDLAMAVKRDCKKQLVSQLIKEKLHLGGGRSHHSATTSGPLEPDGKSPAVPDQSDKAKLLFGNSLQRTESQKRSFFKRKK